MHTKKFFMTISVLSLLVSASVSAHVTEPGVVLPHIFTGEHLLILVVAGIGIAGVRKLYRRFM